ncbi:hypothetical protein [Clostridium grantii]|uniref:Uncharacterized protein n=1 Tax=Clostridium grantii DSM 8605 TaxID=1121316 RepID=A0A1M5Y7R3_9CLOT|nr:hypothetical protein [Clostridium grantii]SHI07848.1 hypothetical protein SAMN02745207_04253 [Clostridium grantii DSM 8605]
MIKFVNLVLSIMLSCLILMPTTALASSNSNTITINEYEQYKSLKELKDFELEELGYTKEDIKEFKNLDYKKELKDRSKLSKEQLKNMGYSDEKINGLKSYDGSEEQTSTLSATLSLSSNIYSASATKYKVNFNWAWSSAPIFWGNDVVGCAWSGTNPSSQPMNLAYSSNSYHTIYYKWTDTGKTYSQTGAITRLNDYGLVAMHFSEGTNLGEGIGTYAYKGSGRIEVNTINSATSQEICMRFEYGHNTIGLKPSVSASGSGVGLNISFSWYIDTIATSMHRYNRYGSTLS